jgi:hypothetical protein
VLYTQPWSCALAARHLSSSMCAIAAGLLTLPPPPLPPPLHRPKRMEELVRSSSTVLASKPLTIKIRKGYNDGQDVSVAWVGMWGRGGDAWPALLCSAVLPQRVCVCRTPCGCCHEFTAWCGCCQLSARWLHMPP